MNAIRTTPLANRALVPASMLFLVIGLVACGTSAANRDPTGETFPSVRGTGLDDRVWSLPDDLHGAPAILLVGYEQDAQFDADRWLLGLLDGLPGARILEVPTIDSAIASLFSGSIDQGMREGIPSEDWAAVVTVYDDAERIVALTGNERGRNMRVLLLDAEGRVVWFHDRGYSANKLRELRAAWQALEKS